MSNLDNLISKIIEEGKIKADLIIEKGKKDEEKIIKSREQEGLERKKEIIKKAEDEAKSKRERIISNANINVRNNRLKVKQNVIEKIFIKSIEALKELPKDQYLKFIKESILTMNIDGDEQIIIAKKDSDRITSDFIKELNKELNKLGKKGSLKLSDEKRDFKGGFILLKEGIEINNTFEALVYSLRDELEYDIANILFDS